MERITLTADDGMYYTDGIVYGRQIHLAKGMTAEGWYQVTDMEYAAVMAGEVEQNDFTN